MIDKSFLILNSGREIEINEKTAGLIQVYIEKKKNPVKFKIVDVIENSKKEKRSRERVYILALDKITGVYRIKVSDL